MTLRPMTTARKAARRHEGTKARREGGALPAQKHAGTKGRSFCPSCLRALMPSCLCRETASAAARASGVRVLEYEASPHQLILEVDFCPIQVQVGFHIAEDADAEAIHLLVGLALGFLRQ